jgi:hypothetical protein
MIGKIKKIEKNENMRVRKKYMLLAFCVCCVSYTITYGQSIAWKAMSADEAVKIYSQLNALYSKTSSYGVTVKYASFKDYTTTTEYETSTGYFKKYSNDYHSFLMGIHTIQNTRYKVVVDTSRKIIAVANPDSTFEKGLTMADYSELLKNCTSIKSAGEGDEKHYRLEFKKTYYVNAYEYTLNSSGWIKELTLYFNKTYTDEDGAEKNIKPRLQITYTDYVENIAEDKNEFDESKYFSKNGYKLVLTAKYKDYYLSDQRVVPN